MQEFQARLVELRPAAVGGTSRSKSAGCLSSSQPFYTELYELSKVKYIFV